MAAGGEAFVGDEHAAEEGGSEAVGVEGRAGLLGEGSGDEAEFGGPAGGGGGEVQANADDEVADVVGVDAGLGENAAAFTAVEKEVVGPLHGGGGAGEGGDELAEVGSGPKGKGGHAGRGEAGTKGEGKVEIAVGLAEPAAAEAAAALGLAAGEEGEGGGAAGGELAHGLVVGGVDLVENAEGKIGVARGSQGGGEEGGVEGGGAGGEAVATGVGGLEVEALLTEAGEVLPDGDAAQAEAVGEGGAGDEGVAGFEEGAKEDDLGGGGLVERGRFHASGQSRPMSVQTLW